MDYYKQFNTFQYIYCFWFTGIVCLHFIINYKPCLGRLVYYYRSSKNLATGYELINDHGRQP